MTGALATSWSQGKWRAQSSLSPRLRGRENSFSGNAGIPGTLSTQLCCASPREWLRCRTIWNSAFARRHIGSGKKKDVPRVAPRNIGTPRGGSWRIPRSRRRRPRLGRERRTRTNADRSTQRACASRRRRGHRAERMKTARPRSMTGPCHDIDNVGHALVPGAMPPHLHVRADHHVRPCAQRTAVHEPRLVGDLINRGTAPAPAGRNRDVAPRRGP